MSHRARRSVAFALVIGVLGVAAPPLRAGLVVLDFADVNPLNAPTLFLDPLRDGPYQSHGFTLSSPGGFDTYGTSNADNYAGEKSLAAVLLSLTEPTQVLLKQTDGGAFDLLSIDLARNFRFDPAPTVTFTGTRADGGTVSETFTVAVASGFQTFDFTGFTDLTQVTWDQPPLAAGLHQFSNIHLETPTAVPAPPNLVLGGIAACGGLLLAWRRRVPTGLRR
jgi:hypothetical protein